MIRTQIQLTKEQARRLKAVAADRGISVSELVRQSVDAFTGPPGSTEIESRRLRAIAVAGRFRSGRRDVSVEHDRYLAEAWQE